MPSGTAPAPEMRALAERIEDAFDNPALPTAYHAGAPGGQRQCFVLLAHAAALPGVLGWRLAVLVYAYGVTQAEALQLQGMLTRWEGLAYNVRQEAMETIGTMSPDRWIAAYSCDVYAEFREPGIFAHAEHDTPAGELTLNVQVASRNA